MDCYIQISDSEDNSQNESEDEGRRNGNKRYSTDDSNVSRKRRHEGESMDTQSEEAFIASITGQEMRIRAEYSRKLAEVLRAETAKQLRQAEAAANRGPPQNIHTPNCTGTIRGEPVLNSCGPPRQECVLNSPRQEQVLNSPRQEQVLNSVRQEQVLNSMRQEQVLNSMRQEQVLNSTRQEQVLNSAGPSRQEQVLNSVGPSGQEQALNSAGTSRQEQASNAAGASRQESNMGPPRHEYVLNSQGVAKKIQIAKGSDRGKSRVSYKRPIQLANQIVKPISRPAQPNPEDIRQPAPQVPNPEANAQQPPPFINQFAAMQSRPPSNWHPYHQRLYVRQQLEMERRRATLLNKPPWSIPGPTEEIHLGQIARELMVRELSIQTVEQILELKKAIASNSRLLITEAIHDWGDVACVICFQKLIDQHYIRELRCRHNFHQKCIDEWLMNQMNCPICRQPLIPELENDAEGGDENAASEQNQNEEEHNEEVNAQSANGKTPANVQTIIHFPASSTIPVPCEYEEVNGEVLPKNTSKSIQTETGQNDKSVQASTSRSLFHLSAGAFNNDCYIRIRIVDVAE